MIKYRILLISIVFFNIAISGFAGNKDRQGESGAGHLVINPWANSAGWNGLNTANIRGIEAMRLNVAGLADIRQTELAFSHTIYLQGADININTIGIGQRVGASGAVGVSIMSMDMGEIDVTTTDNPDGGLGTFSPRFTNIGVSYARIFSNSIKGGFTLRIVSESISDASAIGLALDGGFQYTTGPRDNIRFGLSVRNVGTPMKYTGAGLTFRGEPDLDPGKSYQQTLLQPSNNYELPSLLNIGLAYDFLTDTAYRFTLVGNFTSNAFGRDQVGLGGEFSLHERFMFRVGYRYEQGIFDQSERTTVMTGFAGGFSVRLPISSKGTNVTLDYAYRTTNPYKGIHNIGFRLAL